MLSCGIDEAGRGPLIGPLVIAGVLVDHEETEALRKMGVKDSKLLSKEKIFRLSDEIKKVAREYEVIVVPVDDIDASLNANNMNLNLLEAKTSAKIINKMKPQRVVADSLTSSPKSYKDCLLSFLKDKDLKMVVETKADLNHLECSAASILAKASREEEIEKIKKKVGDFGSGYMSDPKTAGFLKENYAKYPDIFRKTWAPFKKIIEFKEQKTLFEGL